MITRTPPLRNWFRKSNRNDINIVTRCSKYGLYCIPNRAAYSELPGLSVSELEIDLGVAKYDLKLTDSGETRCDFGPPLNTTGSCLTLAAIARLAAQLEILIGPCGEAAGYQAGGPGPTDWLRQIGSDRRLHEQAFAQVSRQKFKTTKRKGNSGIALNTAETR